MARLDAESRRKQLVDATVRVIAEHGVAGATTRRIVSEAGCPLASLHYAFHTKDDLFDAVYENLWEQTFEPNQGVTTTAEQASTALKEIIEWLIAHPELARAQAELFYWSLRNNPELTKRSHQSTIVHFRDFVRKVLREPTSDAKVDELANLFLCVTDGLLMSWFAQNNVELLREQTEAACKMIERNVAHGDYEK